MFYDDYFEDFSLFDMQIEEFKDSLRNSVKDEIKNKIKELEEEVAELKEFREEKDKITRKCEEDIRAANKRAEEAESKWKKARLHELLGEFLTIGWRANPEFVYGEKCDKCDENRKIRFTSPQGREYTEDCDCSRRYPFYSPREESICKMYVPKKRYGYDDGKQDFYNRYYTIVNESDYDRYDSTDSVYGHDADFEKVNKYRAIFLYEEDCKLYCDWLNDREREKQ